MAETVDEISGGRLILGLGAGWHEPEYKAFGYPFDHRVSRFEEALIIIAGLLRDGHIDFEGKYYQAQDCHLQLRRPRSRGVPIMVGTTGKRMLRLVAEHADLWNAWGLNYFDEVATEPAKIGVACAAVGRDPVTLGRTCTVLVDLPGRAGRPHETPPYIAGDVDSLAEILHRYAHESISHVQIVLDRNTAASMESFARVLEVLDSP